VELFFCQKTFENGLFGEYLGLSSEEEFLGFEELFKKRDINISSWFKPEQG